MSYPGYPPSNPNPTYPPYPSHGNQSNIGFSVPPVGTTSQAMPGYPSYPSAPASASYPPTAGYPPVNPGPAPYSTPYPLNPPQQYPGGIPSYSAPPAGVPQSSYGYPPAGGSPYMSGSSGYGPGPQPSYPSAPGVPPYSAPSAPSTYGNTSYPGAGMYPSNPPSSYASSGYPTSNQGTIKPYSPFDPKHDAEVLRKAMKGIGTDEMAIIRVLGNRTYAQRSQIEVTYKTLFGKDLVSNLKSELGGNLEDVVVGLMMPRARFLAHCLRRAVSGLGTAERTIVEILCTSTNAEIREISNVYQQDFRTSLERDLRSDTSGYFKRLLVSLSVGNRDESAHVDQGRAMADAQALYRAGEARWGTDESAFNAILVSQSFSQLRLVFQEYERVAHSSIEQALQREMSGDLLDGMIAVVKCVRNRIGYFAERLYHSMRGAGTMDSCLVRIIVSRSEIDLKLIKEEYWRMFGRSLESHIASDTSGDYKKMLLEILSE